MKNKMKHNSSRHFTLQRIASILNVSISNCLAVGNKIIGLDRKNKTLVISEESAEADRSQFFELTKVKTISLKKSYGSIKPGELRKKAIGHFLKYIRLKFEYLNGSTPTVLSLYEGTEENIKDLRKLDLRSTHLHALLLEIIGAEKKLNSQASTI